MLKPATLDKGEIIAMDSAYIDYEKFEQLTQRCVTYVTKMKKSLKCRILKNTMYQTADGLMEIRIQHWYSRSNSKTAMSSDIIPAL